MGLGGASSRLAWVSFSLRPTRLCVDIVVTRVNPVVIALPPPPLPSAARPCVFASPQWRPGVIGTPAQWRADSLRRSRFLLPLTLFAVGILAQFRSVAHMGEAGCRRGRRIPSSRDGGDMPFYGTSV